MLTSQLDRLPELVGSLGFPWAKADGYEADDFLGAAVDSEEARGGETLVFTNDRDLFQLASPKTTILRPKPGQRELVRVGPAEVKEIYGVPPELVPDFVALRGDPSDRIPGREGDRARARGEHPRQARLAGGLPRGRRLPRPGRRAARLPRA